MKNLISGILAVALVAGPASAQTVPTAKLPQVTVKLNGASGGGSGDITAVDIATTSPLTGGTTCATGACSFTLGLTGGTLSGLTATKIPVATSATAVGDSAITHVSATGVTTFGGSGPYLLLSDWTGAASTARLQWYQAAGAVFLLDTAGSADIPLHVGGFTATGATYLNEAVYLSDGAYAPRFLYESDAGIRTRNDGGYKWSATTSPNGTVAQAVVATGLQISQSKALVDATATAFSRVAVANNSYEGGVLHYTVYATDGTDRQNRSGSVSFSVLNNAGTETCVFGTAADAVNASTGTLTVTWDCAAGTDTVDLRATADTSLASTTIFTIQARVDLTSGLATVTPQ